MKDQLKTGLNRLKRPFRRSAGENELADEDDDELSPTSTPEVPIWEENHCVRDRSAENEAGYQTVPGEAEVKKARREGSAAMDTAGQGGRPHQGYTRRDFEAGLPRPPRQHDPTLQPRSKDPSFLATEQNAARGSRAANAHGAPVAQNVNSLGHTESLTKPTKFDRVEVHPNVDFDHTVHQRPAVTEEHIIPERRDVHEVERTLSVHVHEHRTVIQPIIDPEPTVEPAKHWAEDYRTGEVFRIPDELGRALMSTKPRQV